MSKEFKIEAGKYYRMRNGERVYVALNNKPGSHNIVGWLDKGDLHVWQPSGTFLNGGSGLTDIISEWVEPERIPWEHLPQWCKWWAKDEDGGECGFEKKPIPGNMTWAFAGGVVYLPPSLNSNYTGDWRTSLRERPEGV